MIPFTKLALAALTLGAGLALAGCQSGKSSPDAMASGAQHGEAIACDKCKTTWVQTPMTSGKGGIIGYSPRKQMVCPDCTSAVANMFATGKYEHTCPACGGNMSGCDIH